MPQTNRQATRIKHQSQAPTVELANDPTIEAEIQTKLKRLGLGPGSQPVSLKQSKRRLRGMPTR